MCILNTLSCTVSFWVVFTTFHAVDTIFVMKIPHWISWINSFNPLSFDPPSLGSVFLCHICWIMLLDIQCVLHVDLSPDLLFFILRIFFLLLLCYFFPFNFRFIWLYVLIMSCMRFRVHLLYSSLHVKELLARSKHKIWSLCGCNWTQTHNHLVY